MPAPDDPTPPRPAGASFARENGGLEFDRVSFFSDAIYAIAMTLLVVDLRVPDLAPDAGGVALFAALTNLESGVFGFFLGFLLLGRYWVAHHRFFRLLGRVDGRLISLNLLYLALVAFMPFPVSLLSQFSANVVSVVLFGLCMAAISLLELVMLRYAAAAGLTRRPPSAATLRFATLASGTPPLIMLASLPLAAWSPGLALLSWLLMIPVGRFIDRRQPADFRDFAEAD